MYCRPFFGGKEYFVTVSLERRLKNGCGLPGVIRLPPPCPPRSFTLGRLTRRGVLYPGEIYSPGYHTPDRLPLQKIIPLGRLTFHVIIPCGDWISGLSYPNWHTRAPQTVELSQSIGNKRLNSAGLFGINGWTQPFVSNRPRQNS